MKAFRLHTITSVFYEFSVDASLEEEETREGEVPCKNHHEKHNLNLT